MIETEDVAELMREKRFEIVRAGRCCERAGSRERGLAVVAKSNIGVDDLPGENGWRRGAKDLRRRVGDHDPCEGEHARRERSGILVEANRVDAVDAGLHAIY